MYSRKFLNFTSNDVIDSITFGDECTDIIGYVDEIQSDQKLPNSKFYKLIVNNAQGRRVQVVAWNDFISRIHDIDRLFTIVHMKKLTACSLLSPIYNLGNVNYELMYQDDSVVETFGPYRDSGNIINTTIDGAVSNLGLKIKVEGFLKMEFQKRIEDKKRIFVGALTDSHYQIDLKVRVDISHLNLRVGQAVSVTGVMGTNTEEPPVLYIDWIEHIVPLNIVDLPPPIVYLGNRYPRRVF